MTHVGFRLTGCYANTMNKVKHLSETEYQTKLKTLNREWVACTIVFLLGFIFPLFVIAAFIYAIILAARWDRLRLGRKLHKSKND